MTALQALAITDEDEAILTVADWLTSWVATRVSVRSSTLHNYAAHIDNHLIPYLGAIPLGTLTHRDIQQALGAIGRHSAAAGRPVTAATIHRIHATLRTALNAAHRAQLIADNPARYVDLPKTQKAKAVVWTDDRIADWKGGAPRPVVAVWTATQTAQFLDAIVEHRLYAAFHLIALRGLRRGEAAGLRWCDLDLDAATATITWQVQRVGGLIVQGPPKTASSRHQIALDRTTVAVLRRHRVRQNTEAAHTRKVPSGFVFTNIHGQPFSPDYLTRTFADLVRKSGLPPIRLHDLRHGAASLALQAGANLRVVQDQLGHSSIVLTADTYVSVLPDLSREAAEDTAALIVQAGRLVPGRRRPRRKSTGRATRHPAPSTPLGSRRNAPGNPTTPRGATKSTRPTKSARGTESNRVHIAGIADTKPQMPLH